MAQQLWSRLRSDQPARFQLVLGPRRVGKSTVLYQTVRRLMASGIPTNRLWWLRLDHPLLMQIPLGELTRVIMQSGGARSGTPVFVFWPTDGTYG